MRVLPGTAGDGLCMPPESLMLFVLGFKLYIYFTIT